MAVMQGKLSEVIIFLFSDERNETYACINLYSVKANVISDVQNQIFFRKVK